MRPDTAEKRSKAADGPVKITAVVVTCNDERYLKESLESLAFCDQLIVVDLESIDASVEMAKQAGAEVLRHKRVPVVEKVRGYALAHARNNWILFQDPDEVLPASLARQVEAEIKKNPHAAVLRAPWQFYFKGKPLNCCMWGVPGQSKRILVHRDRVRIRPLVHKGYDLMDGFEEISIPREGDNFIRHYWMSSWGQLIEKHRRYITQEGESRYNAGQRFSWRTMATDSRRALTLNLFNYRGVFGGFTGIALSFFYCWYVFMSHLSLRKYENGHTAGE